MKLRPFLGDIVIMPGQRFWLQHRVHERSRGVVPLETVFGTDLQNQASISQIEVEDLLSRQVYVQAFRVLSENPSS